MENVINFLIKNKKYYQEYFINDRLKKCTYGYTCDINQIYCYLNLINIENTEYYNFYKISKEYFDLSNKTIVEFCCGKIPILSSIYSDNGLNITAIDKEIVIKNYNNVKTIEYNLMFDYNIKKYDIVLAIRPCDPTDNIINTCLKYKKSFMIYLCPCTHKSYDGKSFKNYNEWIKYLKSKLDSRKDYITYFIKDNKMPDDCFK